MSRLGTLSPQAPRVRAGATAAFDFLSGGGGMGALMRAHDWAASPLGPPERWPQSLRTVVDVLLTSRFSMWMGWGPELTFLYNERYRLDTLGVKHPWALGAPAREVWAEIWDDIGPMLESVRDGRGATWVQDMRLLMDRHGFLEETYFTFSYSAVHGRGGVVEGVVDIASETTEQVIRRRRLELLTRLTDRLAALEDPDELAAAALPLLREYPDDLPYADLRAAAPAGPVPAGAR
jgi:hypothetical protein